MAIDYRVGIRVIYHHTHLRRLKHIVLQQPVNGRLYVLGPRKRIVFQEQTVVIVPC